MWCVVLVVVVSVLSRCLSWCLGCSSFSLLMRTQNAPRYEPLSTSENRSVPPFRKGFTVFPRSTEFLPRGGVSPITQHHVPKHPERPQNSPPGWPQSNGSGLSYCPVGAFCPVGSGAGPRTLPGMPEGLKLLSRVVLRATEAEESTCCRCVICLLRANPEGSQVGGIRRTRPAVRCRARSRRARCRYRTAASCPRRGRVGWLFRQAAFRQPGRS